MSHRWHCSDWDCYIKSSRLSFPLHFHIDLYFRHGILYLLWTPDKSILSRAVSIWTNVVLRRCRSVHVILVSLFHFYVKTPLVASCLVVSAQSVTLLVRLPSLVIHTSLNALKCRSFPHFAEDCRLNFIWPGATKHLKHRVDAVVVKSSSNHRHIFSVFPAYSMCFADWLTQHSLHHASSISMLLEHI